MEKTPSAISENIPSTNIYLDDLFEIMTLLESENEKVNVEIKHEGNTYKIKNSKEVEELKSISADCVHDISLNSHSLKRYVSVDLQSFSARIYISDDSVIGRGLLGKIKSILLARKTKFSYIRTGALSFLLPLVVGPFVVLSHHISIYLSILLGAAYVLFIVDSYILNIRHYSTLQLKYKSEKRSFLETRKEDIAIAVISAIVGALASYALIKLLS